jgi:hypothetical protein
MSSSNLTAKTRRPLTPGRFLRLFVIGYALVEALLIGVALLTGSH